MNNNNKMAETNQQTSTAEEPAQNLMDGNEFAWFLILINSYSPYFEWIFLFFNK